MQYTAKLADGSTKSFSEAQLVADVLNELRGQVQLVIGYAVSTSDIKEFLQRNGIEP